MKDLKKSSILLMLLTVILSSQTFAQDYFTSLYPFPRVQNSEKLFQVVQNSEYTHTGYEVGSFFEHPLLLDGKPLDYNKFKLSLKGELTVIKGAPITGEIILVPFRVYLRRSDGVRLDIPESEMVRTHTKLEISKILRHALPGDQLVIEAANKEDGAVKRILQIPDGC
jgi:hypothetical protein